MGLVTKKRSKIPILYRERDRTALETRSCSHSYHRVNERDRKTVKGAGYEFRNNARQTWPHHGCSK